MNAVVRSDVRQLYDNLTETSDHGKLGWSSREVQLARFNVIANLVPNYGSILDVGCGLGDLIQVIPTGLEYTGLDFNSAFIDEAESRFPTKRFVVSDILDWHLPADTVVASGLLAGYPTPDIVHITRHLFHLANNRLIFNYFDRGLDDDVLRRWAVALSGAITPTPPHIVTDYTPGDVTIMLSHA